MDQDVINLAKAIRQTESGGDFNAKGASGESGAYQWIPSTWKAHAKEALGDENAPMTPSNQNAVAYTVLKKRKDAGLNPAQIAAEWNSGSSTGWENKVGVNKQGVRYDVPQYVKSVTDAYQQYKAGNANPALTPNPSTVGGPQGFNPTPYTKPIGNNNPGAINYGVGADAATPPQKVETAPSFMPNLGEIGSELTTGLSGRAKDLSDAAMTAAQGGPAFALHLASGAVQGAGALAGGLGDVVNAGLQLIPGVQGLEKILGKGVSAVMETKSGQDVLKTFSDFADKNPEIAKDIGATVNVIAAVPILRGLALIKSAVQDAGTLAFKNKVETSAKAEIADALDKRASASLVRAESRGLDPIGTLVKSPTLLPEVVPNPSGGFMYSTKKGIAELDKALDVDEAELQRMLDTAIKKNTMVSIADSRKKVLADIKREYPLSVNFNSATRAVDDVFDSIAASSGGRDMISLNELNAIKREVRSAVFDVKGDVRGTLSADIRYNIGQSLMRQIENVAEKSGETGVRKLNKEMSRKIEALRLLKSLDEKTLKTKRGFGREVGVDVAGLGAEATSHALGLPSFAATLAGRGLAGHFLRKSPKTSVSKLGRYRNPKSTLTKGVLDISKGLAAQGATQSASK